MITLDPAVQSAHDTYKLLIGSVVPRPIALVTTLSQEGVLNAAPFSFFNIVSNQPPVLSVAVQRKNGEQKDTARHAAARGELVIHIVDEDNVSLANETAANLPSDVSEVALAGLTPVASESIAVPGIAEAKVRMECVIEQIVPVGETDGKIAADLILARVVRFHVDERVYEKGRILANQLKPVSRMAGNDYSRLGGTFSIDRPS
ncbi:flavin reductase (DIM6/NTAB) family NADH-FMN oxidoreductase RutF [Paenibacillus phyllosphaerae]|uniref:Flavin reductase (DIM6/NTAB) family NADH-FMN oxidoreductase RutF n=1 Tax=Paenibacillus phyllosphaerae TaxID=274593 RepID=A0A7W5B363_9BACL|nr:flavin reductase family protein [Paenibacillus phyllosphaerae]MBB3113587.1 flavin reductase (DIM6/NTAB) family NADH-FMN oxidoreductase RutF [Paenibacillus phyllosphaerae]